MLNIISRSVYQKHPAGPKKVVDNLIKGLEEIGVSYVLNKNPLDCPYTWIHDDPDAIQYLFENIGTENSTKFIFGPNIFYTPEEIIWGKENKESKSSNPLEQGTYIMPSDWVMKYWRKHGYLAPGAVWPVGVDTEFFKPETSIQSDKVLVYTKQRDQKDVKAITNFLDAEKISYSIFSYGSYTEKELIEAGRTSKLGIIIASSESQGLAIQELLSLNLPLAVFDIEYLSQKSFEESANTDSSTLERESATSVPYFSSKCGLVAKNPKDMKKIILEMMSIPNLNERFSPREFIIQNLSLRKQATDFLNIMKYPIPETCGNFSARQAKNIRNWKNRTWYRPFLAVKYAVKYLEFKLKA